MATLDDIAKNVGVSRRLVASVLAGDTQRQQPKAKMRAERILATAQQMGYRPNAAAKAVAFTTFELPAYEVGRQSVSMMSEQIDAPGDQLPSIVLPYQYRPGKTTASPTQID